MLEGDEENGFIVLTRRVSGTVELVGDHTVRVLTAAGARASVQVDGDPSVTLEIGQSCDSPGGRLHLIDVVRGDRARLGIEPERIVERHWSPDERTTPVEPARRSVRILVVVLGVLAVVTVATVVGYARWRTSPHMTEGQAERAFVTQRIEPEHSYRCERDEGDISIPMDDMDFACYRKRRDGSTCAPSKECPPYWIDVRDGRIVDHSTYGG